MQRLRTFSLLLLATSAVAGLTLVAAADGPTLWRRSRFCRERAEHHAGREVQARQHAQIEQARVERAEKIARRLEALGPEPRAIATLVDASGDPDLARWFLRPSHRDILNSFGWPRTLSRLAAAPLTAEPLRRFFPDTPPPAGATGPESESEWESEPGKESRVSPAAAAACMREVWIDSWRRQARHTTESAARHARLRRGFERTSWRPWESLPADPDPLGTVAPRPRGH